MEEKARRQTNESEIRKRNTRMKAAGLGAAAAALTREFRGAGRGARTAATISRWNDLVDLGFSEIEASSESVLHETESYIARR